MSYSDIFSHIIAYSEPYITLAYSELCHIQSFGIFNKNSYNINFLIVTLILHSFQQNLKRYLFFDYNYINFNG